MAAVSALRWWIVPRGRTVRDWCLASRKRQAAVGEVCASLGRPGVASCQRPPPQLGYGVRDDPQAVQARDAQVRRYDELYNQGGWTRTRLELKVADDPLNASTERQLLLAVAAVAVFAVWRSGRRAT